MPSYVTPKKNTAFVCYVALTDQSDTKKLKANPTLASGDVKVSIDGGAFANITTLPTVTPAAGTAVKVELSASEMNGDNIVVAFIDAAGAEWCDLLLSIQTTARQVDDLATQASLDTLDDYVDTEVAAIKAKTDNLPSDPADASDIAAAFAAVDTGLDDIAAAITVNKGVLDLIKAKTDNLPEGMQRAQPLPNFSFYMASSTDHVTGVTGLTVTAEVSLDGAAFVACANAPTELSDGLYTIDLDAADTDADIVVLKFTAVGADATVLTVKTVQ